MDAVVGCRQAAPPGGYPTEPIRPFNPEIVPSVLKAELQRSRSAMHSPEKTSPASGIDKILPSSARGKTADLPRLPRAPPAVRMWTCPASPELRQGQDCGLAPPPPSSASGKNLDLPRLPLAIRHTPPPLRSLFPGSVPIHPHLFLHFLLFFFFSFYFTLFNAYHHITSYHIIWNHLRAGTQPSQSVRSIPKSFRLC